MAKSLSLLLGAGFSAPMGYPIGKELNQRILNCEHDNLELSSAGQLYQKQTVTQGGYRPLNNIEFDFWRDIIKGYNELKGYFDYEEFYDFIKEKALSDSMIKKVGKKYESEIYPFDQLVYSFDRIYPQLISFYLKDGNGRTYYEHAHMCGPIFPGYTGILNILQNLAKDHIIHVHSLNHDLVFERFNFSDWLMGELCDGFEELGSPYYGELNVNKQTYKVRLERYTGNYDKKFRLYKLHGSIDYAMYYGSKGAVASQEIYVKTKYGINIMDLFKEKQNGNGNMEYERCWFNNHADFLTGTTSKIIRYEDPLLYKSLFELFRQNLTEADSLMLLGYGAKDSEVNKMIKECFDFKNKPSYIINPFPDENVKKLAESISSKLIEKEMEVLKDEDFKS